MKITQPELWTTVSTISYLRIFTFIEEGSEHKYSRIISNLSKVSNSKRQVSISKNLKKEHRIQREIKIKSRLTHPYLSSKFHFQKSNLSEFKFTWILPGTGVTNLQRKFESSF